MWNRISSGNSFFMCMILRSSVKMCAYCSILSSPSCFFFFFLKRIVVYYHSFVF
jgi:hypothetical protein